MRFFFSNFGVLKLPHCKNVYYTCEVDEERSGNVDVVVELIHCLIACNLKHAYKKTYRGWLGFTNWGGASFYLWGDTAQGG